MENASIKNAAIKAFQNHPWYLTEELIVQSLFSTNKVPIKKKQDFLDHHLKNKLSNTKDLSKSPWQMIR